MAVTLRGAVGFEGLWPLALGFVVQFCASYLWGVFIDPLSCEGHGKAVWSFVFGIPCLSPLPRVQLTTSFLGCPFLPSLSFPCLVVLLFQATFMFLGLNKPQLPLCLDVGPHPPGLLSGEVGPGELESQHSPGGRGPRRSMRSRQGSRYRLLQ